ncbi:MAB_1171c family putative transporter [Streptomyces abikoensis]|uniref:MAB_1171c family putative transporter n=1 Tax=Streptomyces abikoensis TaxID=97398 RepID=UPI0033C34467
MTPRLLFTTADILMLAAIFWFVRGRRTNRRPVGANAMAAIFLSLWVAFAAYAPAGQFVIESVVPRASRLVSNCASLAAATAVLAFMFQLSDPDTARRRISLRLLYLLSAVSVMSGLFIAGQTDRFSPQLYALYVFVYITYLGITVGEFLVQTWKQSCRSRRPSQRIGLRMASAGCACALVYCGYKIFTLLSFGFDLGLITHNYQCSSIVTPVRCTFSVAAPALGVLLIVFGLTLPALAWPVSQLARKRWEARSFKALAPLWSELVEVSPDIVLTPTSSDEVTEEDADFFLHRRVIEINDGILTLRAYRSGRVQQATRHALAQLGEADTLRGYATVEAAVLKDAVRAKHRGLKPNGDIARPAPGTDERDGNLRAETEWLLLVAQAYANSDVVRATTDETAHAKEAAPTP